MRIDTLNIHFHPQQPGAMAAAGLAALLRTSADARTGTETAAAEIPAIGDPWPGVAGIYAGLSRGADGEPDAHLVLLTAKPDKELNWKDALAWAAGLGDDAHVPTRDESALLYAHLRDEFSGGWHWISTQYSESRAWIQYFSDGVQDFSGKEYEGLARAVRRFAA